MTAMSMEHGRFGSLYRNLLLLKIPGGEFWYALVVNDRELQFDLYCNDASIEPAHSGELTKVLALGKSYEFACWRVHPANSVSETMVIADLPQARPNVGIEPPRAAGEQR